MRRLVALYWFALTEHADEKTRDRIEEAIDAHDRWLTRASLATTGKPYWWDDDDPGDVAAFARLPRR